MTTREKLVQLLGTLSAFSMLDENATDPKLEIKAAKETGMQAAATLQTILTETSRARWALLDDVEASNVSDEVAAIAGHELNQIQQAGTGEEDDIRGK